MDKADCRLLLNDLGAYLDGEAEDSICAQIETHMAECPDCRVVVDTVRKTIHLYRETEHDWGLPIDVRERLFKSLELDEFLNGGKAPLPDQNQGHDK